MIINPFHINIAFQKWKLIKISKTRNLVRSSVLCLVAQSCLTLCNPMDCSLPGFFVHGDSPGKNTGVGCHALLQGIFPTQGSNPGFLHCRQILYHLSHQGSPLERRVVLIYIFSILFNVWFHRWQLDSHIFFIQCVAKCYFGWSICEENPASHW